MALTLNTTTAMRGSELTLVHGELLFPNGSVFNQFYDSGALQCDRYTISGAGRETYTPRFTWHGFQHVQVSGPAATAVVHLVALRTHSDVRRTGGVALGPEAPVLATVQAQYVGSQTAALQSVPVDCPHRERHGMRRRPSQHKAHLIGAPRDQRGWAMHRSAPSPRCSTSTWQPSTGCFCATWPIRWRSGAGTAACRTLRRTLASSGPAVRRAPCALRPFRLLHGRAAGQSEGEEREHGHGAGGDGVGGGSS